MKVTHGILSEGDRSKSARGLSDDGRDDERGRGRLVRAWPEDERRDGACEEDARRDVTDGGDRALRGGVVELRLVRLARRGGAVGADVRRARAAEGLRVVEGRLVLRREHDSDGGAAERADTE